MNDCLRGAFQHPVEQQRLPAHDLKAARARHESDRAGARALGRRVSVRDPGRAGSTQMFSASEPFLLFDYFRVPYTRAADGDDAAPYASVRALGGGEGALHWVPASVPAPSLRLAWKQTQG